jgi:hypothetical protein
MSDPLFKAHIERLRSSVLQAYSFAQLPEWMEKHTKLKGKKFSFKDHEYQLAILRDTSTEINVQKCSQIGMSELSIRSALGMTNIMDGFTVIYTVPTASFARTFTQTRINPIITESQEIRYRLSATIDNAELKQFGTSFLYVKGTIGQSAAISVPADVLFHDELDFSDPTVISSYQSRISHSEHKLVRRFSTPTVSGRGICAEMETSRRLLYMCKCHHCNEWFLPDYFKNVRVPNFRGELHEITKDNLHHYKYEESWVECPKCGKRPNLDFENREWVCENPDATYAAAGYQIQPFDAPRVMTPGAIVKTSTTYSRYADFINFGLGLPAEDKESSIVKEDVDAAYVPASTTTFFTHVMGVDMGLMCHVMIGGVDILGRLVIIKTERVPLERIGDRYEELRKLYRVMVSVMDTVPYVETVMRLQKKDPNLYGSLYVDTKDVTPFVVQQREEKPKQGKLDVRQVSVNRNKALDVLLQELRTGQIFFVEDENRATVTAHLQDMKRIKGYTQHHDVQLIWTKSNRGEDHFHHTLLYAWVAAKMRGVSIGGGVALPLVARMPLKQAA